MNPVTDAFQVAQNDWGQAELDRTRQLLDQYRGGFNAMNAPSVAPAPVQSGPPDYSWLRNALMQMFWNAIGGQPRDPRAQQATMLLEALQRGGAPAPAMAPSARAVDTPGGYNIPRFSQIPQPMMARTIR